LLLGGSNECGKVCGKPCGKVSDFPPIFHIFVKHTV
jgi:hypothetical protein